MKTTCTLACFVLSTLFATSVIAGSTAFEWYDIYDTTGGWQTDSSASYSGTCTSSDPNVDVCKIYYVYYSYAEDVLEHELVLTTNDAWDWYDVDWCDYPNHYSATCLDWDPVTPQLAKCPGGTYNTCYMITAEDTAPADFSGGAPAMRVRYEYSSGGTRVERQYWIQES